MPHEGALTAEMMTRSLAELFGKIYVMGPMTTTPFPRLTASTSFLRAAQQLLSTLRSTWTRAPPQHHTPRPGLWKPEDVPVPAFVVPLLTDPDAGRCFPPPPASLGNQV